MELISTSHGVFFPLCKSQLLKCVVCAFQLREKEEISEEYREGEGTAEKKEGAECSQSCGARI